MRRFIPLVALFAASPAFANGSDFDLIYEPSDGSLWFDTNGGRMLSYVIQGGPFFGENHVSAIIPPDVPKPYDSAETQLGSVFLGAAYLDDPVNIGQVLPAGLSETDFFSRITSATYVENLGQGYLGDLDVFYGFPDIRQAPFGGTGPDSGPTGVRVAVQGLFDANGQLLAAPTKTMAVIDVDGDGIAGFNFENWTGDSFLPDPDDVLVSDPVKGLWDEKTGDLGAFEPYVPDHIENSVFNSDETDRYAVDVVDAALNDANTVGAGDQIYLFYFPELPLDAQSPGMFQSFGVLPAGFLSGPNEFTDYQTIGVDTVYLADNETGEGTLAQFLTVPEPTTLMLVAMPMLAVLRRRRQA